MIEIKDVHKVYRMGDVDVHALRGVSLKIEAGEFVAIMGPSGSGKSTLMHILGLLDVPDKGSYKLLGREVSKLTEDELADLRGGTVGFVFQQFNLLARTPAVENAALPLLYGHGGGDPEKLLKDVGLGSRLRHKPSELSGGQQQRVAIARALVNNPVLLFADEPTGNLDSASEEEIMKLLRGLSDRGITVILVTHEPDIAKHAQRVIRMRDGQVASDESSGGASRAAVSEMTKNILPPGRPRRTFSLLELGAHARQAFRALRANKVRSGLSMLGILIGVAAVVAVLALGAGARQSMEAQLSSLGSNLLVLRPGSTRSGGVAMEAGSVTRFTAEDARAIIEDVPQAVAAAPTVTGSAQVVFRNKNWRTQVVGTTPSYAEMRSLAPVLGRFFTEDETTRRARVAVLGATVQREIFGGDNPIGEYVKVNRVNFQVVGVLPARGASGWRDQDDILVVPLATAMRRLLGKDFVDTIDIQMREDASMTEAEEDIARVVMRRHKLAPGQEEAFRLMNLSEIREAVEATSKTLSMLLSSIAAISLLVGGIGIMNIMLVSVTERTREIGLRKAVGARRLDILAQFLIESVVVSLLGGALGLLLGAGVSLALARFAGWTMSVSPQAVFLSVAFSAGVGVVFGMWPARKAAGLNPIQALRYE